MNGKTLILVWRIRQFRYNAKFEAPRTAGGYRAVVVDGSGKEVSDPITGTLLDRTHDVILSWWPR